MKGPKRAVWRMQLKAFRRLVIAAALAASDQITDRTLLDALRAYRDHMAREPETT
jgi:hypothetical protein